MHNNHPQGHAPASDLLEKLRALRAAKQQQQPNQSSGFGPPPTATPAATSSSFNQQQQWPPAGAGSLPPPPHAINHHQPSPPSQHQQQVPNPSMPPTHSSSQTFATNNNNTNIHHHHHHQSYHQQKAMPPTVTNDNTTTTIVSKSMPPIVSKSMPPIVSNGMETPNRGPPFTGGYNSGGDGVPTPWSAAGTPSVAGGGGGSSSRQPMTPDAHAAHAAARVNRNVQRWAALGTTIPSFVTQPKPPSLNVITHVPSSMPPSASASRASNPSAQTTTTTTSLRRVSTAPISLDDDDEEGVDLFEPNYDVAAPHQSSSTARNSVNGGATTASASASAAPPTNSFLQKMQELSSRVQDAKHQQFLSEIARKPSTSLSGGGGRGGRGGFGGGRGGKRGRENDDTQDDEADNSNNKGASSKGSTSAKRPSPKTTTNKSSAPHQPSTNNLSTPSSVAPSAPITKTFLYRPGTSGLGGAAGGGMGGGGGNDLGGNPLIVTNINSLLHTPLPVPSSDACNALLFKEIQRQIDDPERIQAPCVCIALDIRPLTWAQKSNNSFSQHNNNGKTVACVDTTMTHSNFSISAESGAKLLGGHLLAGGGEGEECRVPVSHSHKAIKGCWVMLENSRAGGSGGGGGGSPGSNNNSPCMFYIPDGETATSFLFTIFEKYEGVEVVTFNASCITMPMLSYSQHLHSRSASPSPSSSPPIPTTSTTTTTGRYFATSCLSDVRTMGWMISPNQPWADFDSLFLSMGVPMSSITLPHTATTGSSFSNSAVMKLLGEHPATSPKGVSLRLQLTLPLYRKLYGSLGTQGLLQAFLKTEKLVGILCASMKYNGCCVDTSIVEVQRHTAEVRMEQLKIDALKYVPSHMHDTFNIQSTEDIRVVLYEHLELKSVLLNSFANAETKGGKLSTAEDALKALTDHHPLPSIILEYRRVAKLFQTYFCGVLERGNLHEQEDHLEGATGSNNNNGGAVSKLLKVHPNFLQEATDTGRLSCVDPNLQNLPRATELSTAALDPLYNPSSIEALATSVRRSFVAPKGYTLICIDYEQIELRVLAFLSQDKTLMDSLSSQDPEASDIHRRIASTVFQKPMKEISSSERSQAKRVVFGVLYGMGARALAAQTGMTFERATQIQNAFKKAFPTIDAYHRSVLEGCKREKMVRTILGRIRPLPEINDPSMGVRAQAERQAFNTVIQGSAADIVKRAMVQVHYNVLLPFSSGAAANNTNTNNTSTTTSTSDGGRIPLLIGQVHDELIFAIPNTQLSTVIPQIRSAMTGCFPTLTVPLRVQVLYGPNLADLKPWSVDGDFGLLDNMSQCVNDDIPWL